MSNSQDQPWSDNPNAPKISHSLYVSEKAIFAGHFLHSILYGMLILLFFKCMAALFDPVHRKRDGIKWGLVSYTVAMFSFATVCIGIGLHIHSVSYVDNREFTNPDGTLVGPYGYQSAVRKKILGIIPNLMYLLNNLLADGLLIYRCYIIYAANLWVIVPPCLVYLAVVATGTRILVNLSLGKLDYITILLRFGVPYFSISVALNILLTLMIVIRLLLHCRDVCTTLGISGGISGLYKTIITMLVESCALITMSLLLVIGFLGARNPAADTVLPILAMTQAIAPLLIIQRVANKSALTSNTIAPVTMSSFRARTRGELTTDNGAPPIECTTSSGDKHGNGPRWVETTIGIRRDSEA